MILVQIISNSNLRSVCQLIGECFRPLHQDSISPKLESTELMFDVTRSNNNTLNVNSSNRKGRLSPGLHIPHEAYTLNTELRTNYDTQGRVKVDWKILASSANTVHSDGFH